MKAVRKLLLVNGKVLTLHWNEDFEMDDLKATTRVGNTLTLLRLSALPPNERLKINEAIYCSLSTGRTHSSLANGLLVGTPDSHHPTTVDYCAGASAPVFLLFVFCETTTQAINLSTC